MSKALVNKILSTAIIASACNSPTITGDAKASYEPSQSICVNVESRLKYYNINSLLSDLSLDYKRVVMGARHENGVIELSIKNGKIVLPSNGQVGFSRKMLRVSSESVDMIYIYLIDDDGTLRIVETNGSNILRMTQKIYVQPEGRKAFYSVIPCKKMARGNSMGQINFYWGNLRVGLS